MNRPEDDGFLSRWSRRKAAVRTGIAAPEPTRPSDATALTAPGATEGPSPLLTVDPAPASAPAAPVQPADPPPRMEAVQALTPESDFARFARPDVDPAVRTAALKKLFADPRFNVIDEMDIDIMDYNALEPLPASMLRKMAQSRVLGLFDDDGGEGSEGSHASADKNSDRTPPTAPTDQTIAPCPAPSTTATDAPSPDLCHADEDPAVRLQPDDAAGPAGHFPRAGENSPGQR